MSSNPEFRNFHEDQQIELVKKDHAYYKSISKPTENTTICYLEQIGVESIANIDKGNITPLVIKFCARDIKKQDRWVSDRHHDTHYKKSLQEKLERSIRRVVDCIQAINFSARVNELILAAVQEHSPLIQHFAKVYRAGETATVAVTEDGMNIRFVKDQDDIVLQKIAVRENPVALGFIDNPSDEVIIAAQIAADNQKEILAMDNAEKTKMKGFRRISPKVIGIASAVVLAAICLTGCIIR